MHVGLTQVCDIYRKGHAVSGQRKMNAEDGHMADVECSIHPLADTALVAALGKTAMELYRGFFPAGAKLKFGDRVVLKTESEDITFQVDGEMTYRGPGVDHPFAVEATLKRTTL